MKWISVNDALPEYGKNVLITDGKYVSSGWLDDPKYYKNKNVLRWKSPLGARPLTSYWMPLPEPPSKNA